MDPSTCDPYEGLPLLPDRMSCRSPFGLVPNVRMVQFNRDVSKARWLPRWQSVDLLNLIVGMYDDRIVPMFGAHESDRLYVWRWDWSEEHAAIVSSLVRLVPPTAEIQACLNQASSAMPPSPEEGESMPVHYAQRIAGPSVDARNRARVLHLLEMHIQTQRTLREAEQWKQSAPRAF